MAQLNKLPQFGNPLIIDRVTSRDWYFFWSGLFRRLAPELETPITVGASPYTYVAPRGGFVMVTGGTVTMIEWSRDGTTFYDTGETSGQFTVSAADQLRITHGGAPDALFVPT